MTSMSTHGLKYPFLLQIVSSEAAKILCIPEDFEPLFNTKKTNLKLYFKCYGKPPEYLNLGYISCPL